MKNKNILDAMTDIDFDMVEDAMSPPPKKSKSKILWLRYCIVAACISLFIALTVVGAPLGPLKKDSEKVPYLAFSDDFQLVIEYDDYSSLDQYCLEDGATYTFTSENEAVATVDSTGKVTGISVGSTVITIVAKNENGQTKADIPVRVVDYDHLRIELNALTEQVKQIGTLTWLNTLALDKYNMRGTKMTEQGPVVIVHDTLCLMIEVGVWQLEEIDCSDYENIYFDVYYGPRDPGKRNEIYKKVTLYPSRIDNDKVMARYFVKFYDAMYADIIENKVYWSIIIMYVDGKPVAWSSSGDLKWVDSCMTQIEYALAHPDEIDK